MEENKMLEKNFKEAFKNIKDEILNAQYDIYKSANIRTLALYSYLGKIIDENSKYGNNFINNLSNVNNMYGMFYNCTGMIALDLSNFNTSNVTNISNMFANCRNVMAIYVKEFDSVTSTGWTTSEVKDSGGMFTECKSLIGENGTTITGNPTDATYARIDKEGAPGYFTNIIDKPEEIIENEVH